MLKCALQPKVAKNSPKPLFGGSRPFKVIDVDKSNLLVMICINLVPICNRFHSIRANRGKMTCFSGGVPSFDALVQREPPYPGAQNFVTKNY